MCKQSVEVIRQTDPRRFAFVREEFKKVIFKKRVLINRVAAAVALICILAIACCCSSHPGAISGQDDSGLRAQETSPAKATPTGVAGVGLGLDLVNFTGSALSAVYISPSDSKGWEENVVGADELNDGDTIDLHFNTEERAVLWDIRIESADEHYAEWKGLDLRNVSRITLLLKLDSEPVAVAEIE